jgi:hypothetical protein
LLDPWDLKVRWTDFFFNNCYILGAYKICEKIMLCIFVVLIHVYKQVILSFLLMQRFVMSNAVCMEEFVIMVNVSFVVQIMQATLVRRALQYCPACQCVMMYLLEMLMDNIVHQVNSAYYSNLKL